MSEDLVSIVIPCYNQGQFLNEAVSSALAQDYSQKEVIVVDDGSTDLASLRAFGKLQPEVALVRQSNKGQGGARNAGITRSAGRYILPLDADDRIEPGYVRKAVALMNEDPDCGIVYCRADFFDGRHGLWNLPDYSFPEILVGNCIFAAGLFRRADWVHVGGYREEMRAGWEDFDFWLSIISLGRTVHRLPEILFHYRIHSSSTITQKLASDVDTQAQLFLTIYNRHKALYDPNMEVVFRALCESRLAEVRFRRWRRLDAVLEWLLERGGRQLIRQIRRLKARVRGA